MIPNERLDGGDAPRALAEGGGFRPLLGKGMAMGVAEVVPGVSGGTVAFVTGIYDPLVKSFASFSQLSLKLLASDWRAFARKHNLAFCAVLGLGMAIGFAAVAQVVLWLLDSYGVHVFGLFFGLIFGAVFYVGAQSEWRWLGTIGVAGLAIGLAVGLAVEPAALRTEPSTVLLFAAGALAATAWILPGGTRRSSSGLSSACDAQLRRVDVDAVRKEHQVRDGRCLCRGREETFDIKVLEGRS